MTNSHIKIIICNLGIIYLMNKSLLKQIKIKEQDQGMRGTKDKEAFRKHCMKVHLLCKCSFSF